MVENILNCQQIWHEISNYIDGNIDPALRAAMDEHFRNCQRCASVLAGTRNVVRLYSDDRMLELPLGFSRRLQKRLANNSAAQRGRWSSWSAWLVPVAAMALFVGGYKLTSAFTFRRPAKSILALPANNIPPELQVVVSDGSRLFHVPGCPFIHDKATERSLTAKEAIHRGYVPCTRCLRQYLKTELLRRTKRRESEAADSGTPGQGDRDTLEFIAPGH